MSSSFQRLGVLNVCRKSAPQSSFNSGRTGKTKGNKRCFILFQSSRKSILKIGFNSSVLNFFKKNYLYSRLFCRRLQEKFSLSFYVSGHNYFITYFITQNILNTVCTQLKENFYSTQAIQKGQEANTQKYFSTKIGLGWTWLLHPNLPCCFLFSLFLICCSLPELQHKTLSSNFFCSTHHYSIWALHKHWPGIFTALYSCEMKGKDGGIAFPLHLFDG